MERRVTAYHEAGHAAAHWLFGTFGDFFHIDMRPTVTTTARVSSKGHQYFPGGILSTLIGSGPTLAKARAARNVFELLIGPAAGNRVDPEPAGDWLDRELDYLGDDDASDITRANRTAAELFGKSGGALARDVPTLLYKVAGWIDDCLAAPRVWSVVSALAEQLISSDFMEGEQAWVVMEAAWGPTVNIPIIELGGQWKRRFFPKTKASAELPPASQWPAWARRRLAESDAEEMRRTTAGGLAALQEAYAGLIIATR